MARNRLAIIAQTSGLSRNRFSVEPGVERVA